MRRLMLLFVAVCVVAVPTASASSAKNSSKSDSGLLCVLQAKLAAEAETGSTSTAKGHTLIKVGQNGTIEFKSNINNVDGETFTAAHIHQGASGTVGPAVEMLFDGPPTSANEIQQAGVTTPLGGATGADLCADPSAYYVNYHSTLFPAGAIRGQLFE